MGNWHIRKHGGKDSKAADTQAGEKNLARFRSPKYIALKKEKRKHRREKLKKARLEERQNK